MLCPLQQDLSCLFKGLTIKLVLMTDHADRDYYVHRQHNADVLYHFLTFYFLFFQSAVFFLEVHRLQRQTGLFGQLYTFPEKKGPEMDVGFGLSPDKCYSNLVKAKFVTRNSWSGHLMHDYLIIVGKRMRKLLLGGTTTRLPGLTHIHKSTGT